MRRAWHLLWIVGAATSLWWAWRGPTPTPARDTTPAAVPVIRVKAETPTPPPDHRAQLEPEPLPLRVRLEGLPHEYQRLNNCGPATLGMLLSYWGLPTNQYAIAPILKPHAPDRNVSPHELAAYARAQGFQAHVGVAGTPDLLKRLLAKGYPVIAHTWFVTEDGGMGHYRLLFGYDETTGVFYAQDSFYGPNQRLEYTRFAEHWRVFNHTYLVVYPPERQAEIEAILGPYLDAAWMWRKALETAEREVAARPEDAFAWFNLGTSALALGDAERAAEAYDRARAIGLPARMLWYQFGPFEAYYRVGRYTDVGNLVAEQLKRVRDIEEWYYWRGRARVAVGNLTGARQDFQTALEYNPGFTAAREALERLP